MVKFERQKTGDRSATEPGKKIKGETKDMIEETKSKNGKKTMPDECICCTGERLDPFMDENYYCPKYTGEWDTDKQARECAYKSLTQEEVEKNRRSHGGYREVTCDECENMGEHFGLCKSCEVCHEQERTVVYEC